MTSKELFCHSCKIRYFLGVGCYGTWGNPEEAKTPDQFWQSVAEEDRTLAKNQNTLNAIAEHEGHDFEIVDEAVDDYVMEDRPEMYQYKAVPPLHDCWS